MSHRKTSAATVNVISLLGSADGLGLSASPVGPTAGPSGQAAAPARRSRQRESNSSVQSAKRAVLCRALDELAFSYAGLASMHGFPMPGTYGRNSGGSSPSAGLQRSLANRLRARTDVSGLLEYALVWKSWDILLALPICALRASARRTSGSDFFGWQTPTAADAKGRKYTYDNHDKRKPRLTNEGLIAGWPSPQASTGGPEPAGATGRKLSTIAGWATPDTGDGPHGLRGVAKDKKNQSARSLLAQARMAGWATPTSRDHKDGAATLANTPINGLLGRQVSLSPARTEKRGALNPAFSLWLMGFPKRWMALAPSRASVSSEARGTPSCPNSRRNSSKRG